MHLCKRFALPCALALAAGPAFAGFTTIDPPPYGEDRHDEIFSYVYGGTFVRTGSLNLDFTNGTLLAERIHDWYDGGATGPELPCPTSILGDIGFDDQLWWADFRFAEAEAKFAVYRQEFGYFSGTTSSTYVKLFEQQGYNYNVTGSADLSGLADRILRWARGGEGRVWSSRMADNSDGKDHMVTYLIHGLPSEQAGAATWMFFWEDKFANEPPLQGFDFNDLVVEIQANSGQVPDPTSMSVLAGVLFLGAARRRRHRTTSY